MERLGNQVGTRYVRDALDQVQAASPTAYAMSVRDTDWAGTGSPTTQALWNGSTSSFDAAGVQAFSAAFDGVSSGAIRYEVGLSRNAYGALTAVHDSAAAPGAQTRDAVFEYDLAGRLVAAEVSEHHFEYAYDALQNMTRRELMAIPGGAIVPDMLSGEYRHGDALTGKRRLQRVDMPGTATALATFSYDLAGRMTRVGLGGATDTTMVFDAADRLRVVDEPGAGQTHHRYDLSGERATTAWADGRVERYFGGGLTQRDGRLELHVGLGAAKMVARLNVPELPDGTPSLTDNLGGVPVVAYLHQGVGHGPAVVTDGSGALLEERHHEPYGTPIWLDADYELERLGWNGKPVDPFTGWSDHGARWHGTRFARWLSVDPPLKGPGGLVEHGTAATPYAFVAGNPVMFWDPDGSAPDKIDQEISFDGFWLLLTLNRMTGLDLYQGIVDSQNLRPKQVEDAAKAGDLVLTGKAPGSSFMGVVGELLIKRAMAGEVGTIVSNPTAGSVKGPLADVIGATVPDLITFAFGRFAPGRGLSIGYRLGNSIGPTTNGRVQHIDLGWKSVLGLWEVTTTDLFDHIRDRAAKVAAWAAGSKALNRPSHMVISVLVLDREAWFGEPYTDGKGKTRGLNEAQRHLISEMVTRAGGYIMLVRNLRSRAWQTVRAVQDEFQRLED